MSDDTRISLLNSFRSLFAHVRDTADRPAPQPLTVEYVCASILAPILKHPYRAVALVLAVAFLGWLSGYDVRR